MHHDEYTLKTQFTAGGHGYHWNKQTELVDDVTGTVLAQLSLVNDTDSRTGGKLVIKSEALNVENLTDPIVMTAMVVQERFDESKSYF